MAKVARKTMKKRRKSTLFASSSKKSPAAKDFVFRIEPLAPSMLAITSPVSTKVRLRAHRPRSSNLATFVGEAPLLPLIPVAKANQATQNHAPSSNKTTLKQIA
ncbi:MAG: hypothetical protein WEB58_12540 [Planctomycetaceae bacterium]